VTNSSIGRSRESESPFFRMENRKVSLKTPGSYSILARIDYLMAVRTSWYLSLLKWQLSWCQNPQSHTNPYFCGSKPGISA
jgi:hypothetical protein